MKLFSRKALVAGAAAVALSFAGTSVAAADEPTNPGSSLSSFSGKKTDDNTDTNDGGGKDQNNNGKDGSSSTEGDDETSKAEQITAWISVFTAVIGALAAAFAFASKYLGFKL